MTFPRSTLSSENNEKRIEHVGDGATDDICLGQHTTNNEQASRSRNGGHNAVAQYSAPLHEVEYCTLKIYYMYHIYEYQKMKLSTCQKLQ